VSMLVLRHVDSYKRPRLFNFHERLTTGGIVFTLVTVKVMRDLLREFVVHLALGRPEIDASLRAGRRILRQFGFEPVAPELEVDPLWEVSITLAPSTH